MLSLTRIEIPVPVPILETPEPGAMTETSPELRVVPVIGGVNP